MNRRMHSLRRRLPVWVAVILAITVFTFGTLAYLSARREIEEAVWVRLRSAVERFAQLSNLPIQARLASMAAIARDPEVVRFLRAGGDTAAVRAALSRIGPDTGLTIGIGLRRRDGTTAFSLGRPLRHGATTATPDSLFVTPIQPTGEGPAIEQVAVVRDRGEVLGSIVMVRALRVTPSGVQLLSELLGPSGRLLIGNTDGTEWTDFTRPLGDRPYREGPGRYQVLGEERLVHAARIGTSPILLAASLSAREAIAPVSSLLWRFVGFGVFVVLAAAAAGWLVVGHITRPLASLTAAAEAVATGVPGPPLTVDRDDEIGRLAASFTVMTERVQAARERLEGQVRETTAELEVAQAELFQREKMAVLGQLSSSVGHEIRNPLGVMSNLIYLLEASTRAAPARTLTHLEGLRRQVAIIEKIVSDILDFTRVKEPVREAVEVASFIDSQLERLSCPPEVTIERRIEPVPSVCADPVQTGQILINVFTNALQAMEQRGGTMTVRTSSNNGSVRIDVSDEGSGIAPDARDLVFEPLYTTKLRGIGLGLSVSRSLARANGGDLMVLDSNARGTTFRLELPASRSTT